MKKTNAARILDRNKVKYSVVEYQVDESDLTAQHVAELVGADVEQTFKTIVLRGDKTGPLVAVIPGNLEVDLKKIAIASSNKKVTAIAMKEIQPLTGYIRGGCSPLGMKKVFPTYISNKAKDFESVYVSAGIRGQQLFVDPNDLITITNGEYADIT
jgi:Cys-tRNA(Pro)/Cys-tRNA(Cys) deacylase